MRYKLTMLGIVLFGAGALLISIVMGIAAWTTIWPTLDILGKLILAGVFIAAFGFALIGSCLPPHRYIPKSPPYCMVGYCPNAPERGSYLCKTHGGVTGA